MTPAFVDDFIVNWMAVVVLVLFAAATPGPDFLITVRNAIIHGRMAGLMTALGIALGILVHVSYCILGIAAIIAGSAFLFALIKYAGAAYLLYLGISAVRSTGLREESVGDVANYNPRYRTYGNNFLAMRNGFLTNLLNPKATMFFLALYTQVIDPLTPYLVQSIYGLTAALVAALWFALLAVTLTARKLRAQFMRHGKWIDRLAGIFFILLALRLVFVDQGV